MPLLPSANPEQLRLPPEAPLMLTTRNDEGLATLEHKHV